MKKFFKKSILIVAIAAIATGILAGCGSQQSKQPENTISGEITIKGSDTVLPVAQKAAEVFMTNNPDAVVSVSGGGSGVGIAALLDGTTDIANASRDVKEKEVKAAEDKGITLTKHTIALDGVSVIVNPELGITALTKVQIKDIYTGKITNWKNIGGPDLEIVAFSRDSSSGTYELFKDVVLEGEDYKADVLTEPSNGNIVQQVGQTKGAIGYVGFAYVNDTVVAVTVDGVVPSAETVKDGSYPIARSLFMFTNGEPAEGTLTKGFIDFVLSDAGQNIVGEVGYIPVK
jgi:phosphate transport system substrate-binding protein